MSTHAAAAPCLLICGASSRYSGCLMSCPERYLLFRFGWTGEKLVDLGLVTNITDMMAVCIATFAVPGEKSACFVVL